MNKSELIADVSQKTKLTKRDVGQVVDHIMNDIVECLTAGEKVQLLGFGTFETRMRVGKTGRNPRTGEPVEIPERMVVAFRPGKMLKQEIK